MLADHHAANVLPISREIRRAGVSSVHQIADALNRGIDGPETSRSFPGVVSDLVLVQVAHVGEATSTGGSTGLETPGPSPMERGLTRVRLPS